MRRWSGGSKRQRIHFNQASTYDDDFEDEEDSSDDDYGACRAADSSDDEKGCQAESRQKMFNAPKFATTKVLPSSPERDEWDSIVVLARRWRSLRSRDPEQAQRVMMMTKRSGGSSSGMIIRSQHPHALLHRLAKTSFGETVLAEQEAIAKSAIQTDMNPQNRAMYSAMLASALHLQGKFREALSYWKRAAAFDQERKHALWHVRCEQALRQVVALDKFEQSQMGKQQQQQQQQQQNSSSRKESSSSSSSSSMEHCRSGPESKTSAVVDRVNAKELSYEAFISKYASKSKPVVISGLLEHCLRRPSSSSSSSLWTMDFLRSKIGHKMVSLKHSVEGSPNWAQLEESSCTTFADFIDGIQNGDAALKKSYCHDWSIEMHCPELLEEIIGIPKYFSGDYLQHMPAGSMYKDTWPSLFVGAKGTYSDLHIDAFQSNFWMGLMQYHQQWHGGGGRGGERQMCPPDDIIIFS